MQLWEMLTPTRAVMGVQLTPTSPVTLSTATPTKDRILFPWDDWDCTRKRIASVVRRRGNRGWGTRRGGTYVRNGVAALQGAGAADVVTGVGGREDGEGEGGEGGEAGEHDGL